MADYRGQVGRSREGLKERRGWESTTRVPILVKYLGSFAEVYVCVLRLGLSGDILIPQHHRSRPVIETIPSRLR
jgi:hypothetical protein